MKKERIDERKKNWYVVAGVSRKGGADNRIEVIYGNKTSTTIAGPFKKEEEAEAAKKKIIADFKKTGELPSIPSRKAVINIKTRPKWVKARDFKSDSGARSSKNNTRAQNENNLNTLSMTKERLLNEIAEIVSQKLLKEDPDYIARMKAEDEERDRRNERMLNELDAWYAGTSTMSAAGLAKLVANTMGLPSKEVQIRAMLMNYANGLIDDEQLHTGISTLLKNKMKVNLAKMKIKHGEDYDTDLYDFFAS